MFKRVRRLQISLAAKCQLLFGAAVVLIIAAALAVPWHRFEELTAQLDDGPAEMLARNAMAEHIATQQSRRGGNNPETRLAATQPASGDADKSATIDEP